MSINGRRYSWESISVLLPGGVAVDISSINYGDERSTRGVYGKGSRARGYSQGNYKGEGTVGLRREEFDRLNSRAGGKGLYGMAPVNIPVSYADEGKPTVTDILETVKFMKRETGTEQDDETVDVTVSFIVLDEIKWGGKPAFIPR